MTIIFSYLFFGNVVCETDCQSNYISYRKDSVPNNECVSCIPFSSRSQSGRHHARQLHGQGPPLVRPQLEQVQRRVVGQDLIRRRSDGGHAGEQLQEQVNRLAEVLLVTLGSI